MYFYLSSPILNIFEKKIKEYHIKLFNSKDRSLYYFNNTKKCLWNELHKYVKKKWDISDMGIDSNWKHSNYLWIQVPINDTTIISDILTDLNDNYSQTLLSNLIPKLSCIITKNLSSDERYFSESICEHQNKFGIDQTKFLLDIYFRDIKPNHLYINSDSD
jgi:hypothetical protein